MFLDKMEWPGRKNRIAVGYDLGENYAQISFCRLDGGAPETVSLVAGTEQYNIPALLCKRKDVNQWFYGREAFRCAKEDGGILVDRLLERAVKGEELPADGETYRAEPLLALFMKRSLSLLNLPVSSGQIEVLVITVDKLDKRMLEVLAGAAAALSLKTDKIYFQSHTESFYHYMIHQPRELWSYQAAVCDFSGRVMKTNCLECNKKTTPSVVFIGEREYPDLAREYGGDETDRAGEWDQVFAQIVRELTAGRIVSTLFLIGEGFSGGWARLSLREACKNRRVFQGNNLYSKGACYSALARVLEDEAEEGFVFLGKEKLQANVGMRVRRRGEDSYYALADGGVNWYETGKECEFLLESGNRFEIFVTPLTGKESRRVEIVLPGLPRREKNTTRIHLSVRAVGAGRIHLEMEDLGFGEIAPATHMKWQEEFDIG